MGSPTGRALAVASLLASVVAMTAPAAQADDGTPRWQLSASVESNTFDGRSGVTLGIPYDHSGEAAGWRLDGAVRVWGPLWAEASWREYGGFDGEAAFCDTQPSPTTCEAVPYRFEASGRSLAVRAEWHLIGDLSGFLRYGRNWLDISTAYAANSYGPASTGSNSDSELAFGAGAAWSFDERWSVLLAYEQTDKTENGTNLASTVALGLRFSF